MNVLRAIFGALIKSVRLEHHMHRAQAPAVKVLDRAVTLEREGIHYVGKPRAKEELIRHSEAPPDRVPGARELAAIE